MIGLIFGAAMSMADLEAAVGIDPAMCRIVQIAADGSRTETPSRKPYRRPQSVSVHSRHAGAASSSSVSVSSSSREDGGGGQSRVTLNGRQITATYNAQGCTIVIDDHGAQGAQR